MERVRNVGEYLFFKYVIFGLFLGKFVMLYTIILRGVGKWYVG